MEITGEIHQVGGPGMTEGGDAAVYLLHLGGEAALVDAGCGPTVPDLLRNARECGVEPENLSLLLLTHCHFDHTGGAARLRKMLGCKTVAHEEEAPFLEAGDDTVSAAIWYGSHLTPFPVDVKLTGDRQDFPLGGRTIHAVHIPGHSPGSVAYWLESDGAKVLFGQDVHGPLDASLRSDEEAYRRSLGTLISLEADILCEGHYGVFRGKREVREFIRSFL
ncbi:MAG: MBL fold metallo-hydrolase [Planctomycetota bacterium]|jgi:glyoxylase-like metal-dependent hydrolase (beta-lactamase superfamily II)